MKVLYGFFFSREESKIHIHELGPHGEAKFWLNPSVTLATNSGFSDKEIVQLIRIIEQHKQEIVDAWNRHFKH
ncbi:MAG: DUF4160 domain-containing protein [Treponema sp.]|nr:DUF4160 domain-containing protein [Treponema sp.]